MNSSSPGRLSLLPGSRFARQVLGGSAAFLVAVLLGGCAALTNPLVEGIPVSRLPPELLAEPLNDKITIPLTLLRQPPVDVYRLAPHDVLGVYVEGVLPSTVANQTPPAPPVHIPSQFNPLGRTLPPAVGYPFPVQENGSVDFPLLGPVPVRDKSVAEVEKFVRDLYIEKGILQPGRPVLITLLQQRQIRILVIRQETGGFTTAGIGGILSTSTKRGTGHVIDLPAYENDVLHAVAQTGGLPGLDAYNEIIVFKGGMNDLALTQQLQALPRGCCPRTLPGVGGRVVEIPLRARPGTPPPVQLEDIVLNPGDVVFIEARDIAKFYAGGLLPAGEYDLPRDYDLDVIKAIALIKGSLVNGAFGGNNLSGALIATGIGNPSPSQLTVLRSLPGGGHVPILVDLNRALKDSRERLLVKAGDVLILQEKPAEALTRYFTQTLFNFSMSWEAIHQKFLTGVVDVSAPQQIPGRIGITNVNPQNP